VDRREFDRHERQRLSRRNHVFGIAAIERNSRGEQGHAAGKKLAAPAMIAITAVATVPTNADALASFPRLHSFTHGINNTNYFMSRHTRILNTGPKSFFDYRIAVANTARFDLHAHPPSLRLRDAAFD